MSSLVRKARSKAENWDSPPSIRIYSEVHLFIRTSFNGKRGNWCEEVVDNLRLESALDNIILPSVQRSHP